MQQARTKKIPEPKSGECLSFSCKYCFMRSTKGDSRCSCGCTRIAECNFVNETRNSIFLLHGQRKKCSKLVFNSDHHKQAQPAVAPGKYSTITTNSAPKGNNEEYPPTTDSAASGGDKKQPLAKPFPYKLYLIPGGVVLLVILVGTFVCYIKTKRSSRLYRTHNGDTELKSYKNNAIQNDA